MREELTRIRHRQRARPAHPRGPGLGAGQEREERLAQARERELRLAEQHSLVLTALEGSQAEVAEARSRVEALEQRASWLDAERAREQRAAELDRQRLEEQLTEARNAPAPGPTPEELEALRTELLAAAGERARLLDRQVVLEKQEASARALSASLEERLASAEAALAQANFEPPADAVRP